ncbi:metalloregulator ArsR/SmtB family transcription factor [Acinetobacter sp. NIPH 2699]|uniref:metalloregulator ArsR/SmtB family transcription factor n=1 Tax=Acinetobacter sp. NIPH 2699 TaxID=2923433 RepID=UPI001F4BBEBB|nr:metalloregulator ArsR/SmtB family transcription factor [Acinetobacter sp. NIPH 2699]MCH7337562.1 metalloregulator ArsR/SmtB family transcription factor [Acinetobacter sp. NIPH 2699]
MDQVNFFKCLSDETRLNIVTLVVEHKELCVCDLTEKLQLSQPKISRHLALLRSSGLLQDRRQSQWVYYSINPQLPEWCHDILNIVATQQMDNIAILATLPTQSYCE